MNPQPADLIGQSVGHIRITEVLGRGGMGTVYLGQDEKLRRKVAVKAIHGDRRLHSNAKSRFLQEARILSQMNHRNICVVHEFIEHEDCDFLVLEMVEGRSLRAAMKTQLSRQQKLDIARQLLEVLVAVHGHGVIHRDLKPENIMVRPDGEIAVLDFGLVRSVDDDVSDGKPTLDLAALEEMEGAEITEISEDSPPTIQVKTNLGTVIGTAGYMSPEQARAEPATAASDMYSVGLILQELFTGELPYERNSSSQALVLRTAVGESTPVAGVQADLKAFIERLKSFPPGTRPSSIDALAELRRIIDRPKRQRKRAVVTAVWIALAVLAGGMTLQSIRASKEAERANQEAAAALQVSDFLVNLFEESNPEQARGASLSAEEILNRGAERIHEGLEGQPLTRARLLLTIARVHDGMGLYDDAVGFAEEAVEIRRSALGEEHGEVAEALAELGTHRNWCGDYDQAEADLEAALAIMEHSHEPGDPVAIKAAMNLGNVHSSMGRLDEAESEFSDALERYEAALGSNDVRTARCLENLAIVLARQNRVEEAEPMFRHSLEIQERSLGEDHPAVGGTRSNLAIALKILGRYEDSEALYLRNLEIEKRVLGEGHPDVSKTIQNLGNLYAQQKLYDKAEPFYLQSLEISRAALGEEHPTVALHLANLGGLYREWERWREAENYCLQSLTVRERILSSDHPHVGQSMYNLAAVYRAMDRFRESEELYRRSLVIFQATYPPGHPRTVAATTELAELLREQGRETEAAEIEARGFESSTP